MNLLNINNVRWNFGEIWVHIIYIWTVWSMSVITVFSYIYSLREESMKKLCYVECAFVK